MENILKKLSEIKIIPVVCINDANNAKNLSMALLKGGISAVEITFRSSAAMEAIRITASEIPQMLILAGTILTVENAIDAVKAGASVIVSPGTNNEVVSWCLANNIPVLPGCATPTEVEACIKMGLTNVKLFPAEVLGGVKLLKALYGPYKDIKFMPTGGISSDNLCEYINQPNVIACGGSWIAPDKLIDNGEFDKIEKLAREAIEQVNTINT